MALKEKATSLGIILAPKPKATIVSRVAGGLGNYQARRITELLCIR